jgi:hypothetical protein
MGLAASTKRVAWLLAALPFFFAWRSYSGYFYFASLLMFGAVITLEYAKPWGREAVLDLHQGEHREQAPSAITSASAAS